MVKLYGKLKRIIPLTLVKVLSPAGTGLISLASGISLFAQSYVLAVSASDSVQVVVSIAFMKFVRNTILWYVFAVSPIL